MSTSITFNGTSYTVPAIADASWGTNVANYLIAISTGCLQKTGGTFTLTAELNFGATYGLKAAYIKTQTANTAAAGFLELAKTDTISWRNNANGADLALGINGSDLLTFNGTALALAGLTSLTSGVTGILPIANGGTNSNATLSNNRVMYSNSGSITENAAITGNMALVSNASGLPRSSTVSSTELAYLVGVTSLVQTQIDAKEPTITTLGIARGGTGAGTAALAFAALSPVTTKGDLLTFDTVNNRLPVGSDGQMLTASSGAATGLAWAAAASATLTQFYTDIGNASNARTATNTSLLGNVKATTTSQTYAVTSAAPGVFTISGHGFLTGDKAYVTATQNGFTLNTTYFVHKIDANTFHLSTTYANAVGATYITSSGTTAGVIVSGGLVVQPGPATSRAPTQQAFTSGSSTYTTPANVAWIRVRMVGGGGGGGGGGTAATGSNGSNGVDTTFGSSLLTASAGGGGARLGAGQGPGGTATVNSPAAGIGLTGTNGGAGTASTVTGIKNLGGYGGNSAFGGGGSPGTDTLAAIDGIANTGGGGGGGGTSVSASAVAAGDGGGAGAFIDAIIGSPAATYAYAVGTGGAAGSAGTSGTAGSAGGSGYIIVEEHYF